MKCMESWEKALFSKNETVDAETLKHLAACPECNAAHKEWLLLSQIETHKTREIPQDIEKAILNEAYLYARNKTARPLGILKWSILSAAAACIVFALTAGVYLSMGKGYLMPQPAAPLQLISQGENWKAIDMTNELEKFRNEIDAHINELAPQPIIDTSALIIREQMKVVS
ncbi:MAG: hypothetical protein A2020_04070 [Lentisphaerae bacterium GWF2_45_14]|nr:MAG: hypothetical protein A2020_04070 [Lentisphaerae bacterium GWF2_45_14]